MLVLINNRFVASNKAKVPLTASLMRGYGVFETLRTFENKDPKFIKKHLKRLFTSAKKIHLKIQYSKKQLEEMVKKIAQKSPHKIQRIKILALEDQLIITSVKANIDSKIYQGVSLKSIEMIRSLPDIKSISYLPSYLANTEAKKADCFDAVLIDKSKQVTEGAYSNLFWFENNVLCTRQEDILPGITRQIIIEKSPFKIQFKNIKLADLKKRKEIFITQSVNLVVPVVKIDTAKIGTGKPGPQTKEVMKLFSLSPSSP